MNLKQLTPIILTIVTFLGLCFLLFGFISLLNFLPLGDKIVPRLFLSDILVGLTIYLKTSVDFAIFIGKLMSKNPGWQKRIAIETGTALGNGIGTFFVLFIWTFFKEVPILMVIMIFTASLVLFKMAEEGLEELKISNFRFNDVLSYLLKILRPINLIFGPIVKFIIPNSKSSNGSQKTFFSLLLFSFTVPLILGLDDFAGYIPLFNIINVFGFAVGVFLGHMILNLALFASPQITINFVKKPFIIFFGSIAFVGIAFWGLWEIIQLLLHTFML